MDRLTTYLPDGTATIERKINGLTAQSNYLLPSDIEAVKHLAAYEDTGLEPEAVEACKVALMGKTLAEITAFEGVPMERMIELAKAESEDHLIVLPDVPGKDRQSVLDFLRECRADWIHDPSVGLVGPNENEAALMDAIEAALGGGTT